MDNITGKKILVLTAHPDDEAFVAGGTIFLNNQKGGTTILSCATRGENGRSSLGMEISAEEVKRIRSEELDREVKEIGISKVYIFDFPDRDLAKHEKELADSWREVINSVKPDIILGFGEGGYTGHLDHIVAGRVAHKLATEFKIPYYSASLPGGERHFKFEDYFRNKRNHGNYTNECLHKEPDIMIEVDPEAKYRVLQIYKSQFPGLDPYHIFSKEDAEYFLKHEFFQRLT